MLGLHLYLSFLLVNKVKKYTKKEFMSVKDKKDSRAIVPCCYRALFWWFCNFNRNPATAATYNYLDLPGKQIRLFTPGG